MELHVYYSDLGMLRVSWGRVITEESIRRHFELLAHNEQYPRNLRVVTSTDVEELGFSLTHENMLKLKGWREEALKGYDTVTTALYNLQPIPSAYISYFSSFFDSPKSRMKQFNSEENALRWLMGDRIPKGISGK